MPALNTQFVVSIAALATVIITAPVQAQTFTDTFTQANGTTDANFVTTGTTLWTVQNGTYGDTTSTNGLDFATCVAPGFTNLTNFTVSTVLNNAYDSGILFLADDAANPSKGVILLVRPSLGDIYFYSIADGAQFGRTITGTSYANQNVYVTLTDINQHYTGSIYSYSSSGVGSLIGSVDYDASNSLTLPTSGRVGLYQYGGASSKSSFDNFQVTVNNSVSTAAPEPGSVALMVMAAIPAAAGIARRKRQMQEA